MIHFIYHFITFHLYLKDSVFLDGSIDLYFSKQFEGSSNFFSGSIEFELYISLFFLQVAAISEVDICFLIICFLPI